MCLTGQRHRERLASEGSDESEPCLEGKADPETGFQHNMLQTFGLIYLFASK